MESKYLTPDDIGDGRPDTRAADPIMQKIHARRMRDGLLIVASSGFVVALTCYFYAVLTR